jgi:hypothetical protein
MTDREDRLKSLLDKVRAKRPEERATHAAEVVERIRTASGAVPAVQTTAATPTSAATETPISSDLPTQLPASTLPEPDTSPGIESPTRYSSAPPRVERPLSVEPRARSASPALGAAPMGPISSAPPRPSSGAPQAPSSSPARRPDSIRAQSFAPTGQPIVYTTEEPEFPRPKTFGDLLELTLSLRPR